MKLIFTVSLKIDPLDEIYIRLIGNNIDDNFSDLCRSRINLKPSLTDI